MATLTINNVYCGAVCFGYLYNWYAVDDSRELTSSADWRVPNSSDRTNLVNYTGGYAAAGANLKKEGIIFWSTNTTGSDLYGLHIIGNGERNPSFTSIRTEGNMWRQEEISSSNANTIFFTSIGDGFGNGNRPKYYGQAIRLVKDATGIPDGTTTTYTGNDGKVYNAVVINQLYWTTENLEETQYRNGEYIGGYNASGYIPISDASWAAFTTGALCLYEDNLDYACKGAILGTTTTTIPVTTTTTTI